MACDFDVTVVGAGVVGLAIAERVARGGRRTLVVDRADHYGSETSSRNSEVIHAGHYYLPGSLKARLCNTGRELLYRFCDERAVAYRRCGKLIVASETAQEPALGAILANSRASGGGTLEPLSGAEARHREPALAATAALWSPDTGIVDSHGLMTALAGLAEHRGAQIVLRCEIAGLARTAGGWSLRLAADPDERVTTHAVVLAAGLGSAALAFAVEGYPRGQLPAFRYAKGNYFGYAGRVPFSRLIYPVPVPGGLGTHLTLDLAGAARFGPDVEWIEQPDYAANPSHLPQIAAAVRQFWPTFDPGRLFPDYAGVRPKISGPGEPAADFLVAGPRDHGQDGMVALFGIESPGLTASLALAEHVAALLDGAPAP